MHITEITPKIPQKAEKIRLAPYCRVSSDSADQMHSFATQIRYYSEYEKKNYIHEEDAKVAKYLLTLLESELVIKCETFMGNKKTNYYEIGDPLLKFWYAFI